MKAQMKFQKILALVTLIVGALVFVFALCFISGNLADLLYYNNASLKSPISAIKNFYGADDFNYSAQTFVDILVILGIVYVCAAAFLYITDTNKRRNYYITNYIAVGIILVVSVGVAVFMFIDISVLLGKYFNVDWEGIEYIRSLGTGEVSYLVGAPELNRSVVMFILAYIVALICLVNAVAWALNLVWKVKLMDGEKTLLNKGKPTEVAL